MPETEAAPGGTLSQPQAAELALLVDLEARWENLRAAASNPRGLPPATKELQAKQKVYESFRAKLAAYNRQYAPAHVPELLLNTPVRLGKWCLAMRGLLARVERDVEGHCPSHLLEKAYRGADRIADRVWKSRVGPRRAHFRSLPSNDLRWSWPA